ncbi:MAG: hypothetical protein BGO29_09410 [Bacteroidales bacterium 36-12]|nr:MAG: hypothetical protein BGO29_09410 [Bacteroidales bacterium 36-12]
MQLFNQNRTKNININIIVSFLIKGINIICSFLMVPLTIAYVNPSQYGIWITISSIVAWIGLFDIGLGNGLRNKLAEAKTLGKYELAKTYISTSYILLGIIFSLILIIFFIINPHLNWATILNAPTELSNELSMLARISCSYFCIIFILKIISMVLIADQKNSIASAIEMLGQVINLGIIFILVKYTKGSIVNLGLGLLIAPIFTYLLASIYLYKKDYKKISPSFQWFNWFEGKELLKMGYKFFIPQISTVVVYQSLNILIAQFGTPLDVTSYNISYKLNSTFYIIMTIIVTPYWSAFTEAYVTKDINWMEKSTKRLKSYFYIMITFGFICLLLSNKIYDIWLNGEVKIPNVLSVLIFIYIVEQSWIQIHLFPLNGIGKLSIQYYSSIIETILNIPLAILLGHLMGVYGVILAPIIISLFRCIWTPIQLYKIINNKAYGIWNK